VKESRPPSQGTAGAVDSFHVAGPREREVLSAQQEKTLTAFDKTNSGSHLHQESNRLWNCGRDPEEPVHWVLTKIYPILLDIWEPLIL